MDSLKDAHAKARRAYNLAAQKYHELFHNEMKQKAYDRRLLNSFARRFRRGSLICDAGCGPSAHIGRYLADKGVNVIGIDISDRCIEMAKGLNPNMQFRREDIADLSFGRDLFDGVISYYSIIHTPKRCIGRIFREFHRVLKPDGHLLVAVKAGSEEGYVDELLGIKAVLYFSLFHEKEIEDYFKKSGFILNFLERRNPYDFEISNERIFAIGRKIPRKGRGPS
ncbi:MAG: class I SAM-dependent methyltransferase [Candidatus Aminicenantes bacterium]|nr:class I SAM-dependent methyltransferase [Candidatus Aminicenantes bacterium]